MNTYPTPYNDLVRLQRARKDIAYQSFLSRSFGTKIEATDTHHGESVTVVGYQWRGMLFVTKVYPSNPQ